MSETKMRMTNEWLCRVQQLRADIDALGDVKDALGHVEDALKHLATVPDTII